MSGSTKVIRGYGDHNVELLGRRKDALMCAWERERDERGCGE